jgi:predicted  nucleic acid-binding Zn-ribbon protein
VFGFSVRHRTLPRKRLNKLVGPLYTCRAMAKSRQPSSPHEETLDDLLDKVSNAREELVTIERTLERLRSDISKMQKQRDGSGKAG